MLKGGSWTISDVLITGSIIQIHQGGGGPDTRAFQEGVFRCGGAGGGGAAGGQGRLPRPGLRGAVFFKNNLVVFIFGLKSEELMYLTHPFNL